MNKSIIIVLGLFILTSFRLVSNIKFDLTNSTTEQLKKEKSETEQLVQKILDLPKLQWIYHPEVKERLPVKILESKIIHKTFELNKFDNKVLILSPTEIQSKEIRDYLEFHKLIIHQSTAKFELSFKIEGAGASGEFIKENGVWKILDYSVWEN